MKTFKQEHFDGIYDRTFKSYINHPDCNMSNKHKHKCDWRKKVLNPVPIRNNKLDYTLIALQRIMDLELEVAHLKQLT